MEGAPDVAQASLEEHNKKRGEGASSLNRSREGEKICENNSATKEEEVAVVAGYRLWRRH